MLIETLLILLGGLVLIFSIAIIIIISKDFLRSIFKPKNYIKFMQFILVGTLLFVFVAIFIYFWINKTEVNQMDVIFTVIVGWMGLIMGSFFSQKFMEDLSDEKESSIKMLEMLENYEKEASDFVDIMEDYDEELEELKKQLKK